MSFLSSIGISKSAPLLGSHLPASKPGPEGYFQKILTAFSLNQITFNECIERCYQCLEEENAEADCDLSEASRQLIKLQLANFNIAVDETPYLAPNQVESLKSAFKEAFGDIVKEKWASASAKSFYWILRIQDVDLRAKAAERWSDQFYSGLDYFCKWDDHPLVADYVTSFHNFVLPAYEAYYHQVRQQKMKAFAARAEKDPKGLQSLLQTIDAKEEKERVDKVIPVYSEEEKNIRECARFFAHCKTKNFPEIDKEKKALGNCIWNGFTIRELKGMMKPKSRHEMFIVAFN